MVEMPIVKASQLAPQAWETSSGLPKFFRESRRSGQNDMDATTWYELYNLPI